MIIPLSYNITLLAHLKKTRFLSFMLFIIYIEVKPHPLNVGEAFFRYIVYIYISFKSSPRRFIATVSFCSITGFKLTIMLSFSIDLKSFSRSSAI